MRKCISLWCENVYGFQIAITVASTILKTSSENIRDKIHYLSMRNVLKV